MMAFIDFSAFIYGHFEPPPAADFRPLPLSLPFELMILRRRQPIFISPTYADDHAADAADMPMTYAERHSPKMMSWPLILDDTPC
jgi:hypothetical protein